MEGPMGGSECDFSCIEGWHGPLEKSGQPNRLHGDHQSSSLRLTLWVLRFTLKLHNIFWHSEERLMTKRHRSKCSTKGHGPEVTLKEHEQSQVSGQDSVFWNSSVSDYCAVLLRSKDCRGRLGHSEGRRSQPAQASLHLDYRPLCFIFLRRCDFLPCFFSSANWKTAEGLPQHGTGSRALKT